MSVIQLPQPDGFLSAWNVKGVAADVIGGLPLPEIEGRALGPGDIWSVAILASVNQISVREVCDENHESPCDDTVFDWLYTLDRSWVEFAANLLVMQLIMTILDPKRSRNVSIDFVDNPYHGTYNNEEGEFCRMSPKDGIITCHRYCTAYLVANGKPVTLAMTYVRSDERQADAVERVLDRVEAYPFKIELLLADSGFYNERVIRRSREIAATVVPAAEKGDRHEEKLETHKSYMTTYRMYKDNERELRFPLAVSVSYQNGDRGKHGEVVRGYAAYDLDDRTPAQVEHCYRKRSAIESSYRLFRSARAVTSTQDPIVRFAFVVVSFMLENLGWYCDGRSSPARAGAGATCPRNSRSRCFVTGSGTRWKRNWSGDGRSR